MACWWSPRLKGGNWNVDPTGNRFLSLMAQANPQFTCLLADRTFGALQRLSNLRDRRARLRVRLQFLHIVLRILATNKFLPCDFFSHLMLLPIGRRPCSNRGANSQATDKKPSGAGHTAGFFSSRGSDPKMEGGIEVHLGSWESHVPRMHDFKCRSAAVKLFSCWTQLLKKNKSYDGSNLRLSVMDKGFLIRRATQDRSNFSKYWVC